MRAGELKLQRLSSRAFVLFVLALAGLCFLFSFSFTSFARVNFRRPQSKKARRSIPEAELDSLLPPGASYNEAIPSHPLTPATQLIPLPPPQESVHLAHHPPPANSSLSSVQTPYLTLERPPVPGCSCEGFSGLESQLQPRRRSNRFPTPNNDAQLARW